MRVPLNLIIGCASLGLLTSTALAQNNNYGQSGSSSSSSSATEPSSPSSSSGLSSQGTAMSTAGQEFFDAKSFIGTKAKDSQGNSAGDIRDLVFSPQTGEVFAAFDASNNRYYLVPWQALTITQTGHNKQQVTLNVTKQDLESGPTIPRNQWQQLSNTSFTQTIYSHYNLQQPQPAMGGASSRSLGGSSSGSSQSQQSTQGKDWKQQQQNP